MANVDLAFKEDGPGAGPAVVLVHGFPFDGRMWLPTAKVLGAAGYHVIVPDLRGHGKSPVGEGAATMEAMADDVAGLLDKLAIRRCVLVGFSMGGYAALQVAHRHRERLSALGLVDTRAEADSEEAKAGRRTTAAAIREKGMQHLVDTMLPKVTGPATKAKKPEVVEFLTRMVLENSTDGAVAALAGMGKRPDMRGKLSGMGLPVFVAVGEDDVITPPDAGSRMAHAFAMSSYELIPGAGHVSPLEQPEKFHKVLLEWLGAVSPVRRS
ncbi:MAG: alpha/beta fold hydrolase [bacterium]